MRVSEFWTAVSDEFGEAYGRVLTSDLVLGSIGLPRCRASRPASPRAPSGWPSVRPRMFPSTGGTVSGSASRRSSAVELGQSRQRLRDPSAD